MACSVGHTDTARRPDSQKGFRSGDESEFAAQENGPIDRFLAHVVSVAAINYRLTDSGEHPYPLT